MIERIRCAFQALPDGRGQSDARRYEMEDAALSAFAVFFSQSPSFLDRQIRMQKQLSRNNATSLFGGHKIPCDHQIRHLLDPVPPERLYPVVAGIADELFREGYLDGFRSINDTRLIALDGTDFFALENIACLACRKTHLKNGKTWHRHRAVTPVRVAAGQNERHPVAARIRTAPGRT